MSTEESEDSTFKAHMLEESPDLALQERKMAQTYKLFLIMSGFIVILFLLLLVIQAPTPFYFLLVPLVLTIFFLFSSFYKRQKQSAWIRSSISELHEGSDE
ncbi:MAG: hypothetical protein ACTSWW_03845 [Promethearchaeota archaeon]